MYGAAIDGAGHTSDVEHATVKLDRTPPTTTITLDPADEGGVVTSVGVDVRAADSTSGVAELRCVLDLAVAPRVFDDLSEGPCDVGTVAGEGTHTVYAAAIDEAGNTSAVSEESFVIDTTAPVVTIGLDPSAPDGAGGWYVGPVTVTVGVDEAGATVRCVLDPATTPRRYRDLPAGACGPMQVRRYGQHRVFAAAIDAAGNVGPVVERGFKHVGRVACLARPATHGGTAGPDRIVGTAGDDVIVALGGRDVIAGRGGDDVVCAGRGATVSVGGPATTRWWGNRAVT